MPFPFLFEEPEQKVARKAQNGRAGSSRQGTKNVTGQTDDEMNAAARKAVRPAHSPAQDQSLRISRMGEQGR